MNASIFQHIADAETSLKAALELIQEQFEAQLAGIRELPGRPAIQPLPAKAMEQAEKRRGRPRKATASEAAPTGTEAAGGTPSAD